jgi:5-formyltetrahydrofolate cyclo-ligase
MTAKESSRAKQALREAIRLGIADLGSVRRQLLSAEIRARLLMQPVWREARALLLFAALADEPDVRPLIHVALNQGKRVALPRFLSVRGEYEAAAICSNEDLSPGRFGVLEPRLERPAVDLMQLDFALVPGVGFDLTGRRLGRGSGFYDRLLAGVPGHKCGVAFDCQVVPEVPEESHDVRLNSLVTPTRWCCFERAA